MRKNIILWQYKPPYNCNVRLDNRYATAGGASVIYGLKKQNLKHPLSLLICIDARKKKTTELSLPYVELNYFPIKI